MRKVHNSMSVLIFPKSMMIPEGLRMYIQVKAGNYGRDGITKK